MKTLYTLQEVQDLLKRNTVEVCHDALFNDGTPKETFIYEKLNEYCKLKPDSPILVFKAIKNITGYSKDEIVKKNRKTEMVNIRFVGMSIIYYFNNQSLKRVGKMFNRDHSTVISANKESRNRLEQCKKNDMYKGFGVLYKEIYNEYCKLKNQQD